RGPVAREVRDVEEDRVDASVAAAAALDAQLGGAAVRADDDVVQRVAVAASVLDLVAGDLRDHDVGDAETQAAAVAGGGDEVGHREVLILVVGRAQDDRADDVDRRRDGVADGHQAAGVACVARWIGGAVADAVAAGDADVHGAAGGDGQR